MQLCTSCCSKMYFYGTCMARNYSMISLYNFHAPTSLAWNVTVIGVDRFPLAVVPFTLTATMIEPRVRFFDSRLKTERECPSQTRHKTASAAHYSAQDLGTLMLELVLKLSCFDIPAPLRLFL